MAPDEPSLVSFVSLIAPIILSGNSVVAITSEKFPLPALTFAEILATSDWPGGVVNVLSGKRAELNMGESLFVSVGLGFSFK